MPCLHAGAVAAQHVHASKARETRVKSPSVMLLRAATTLLLQAPVPAQASAAAALCHAAAYLTATAPQPCMHVLAASSLLPASCAAVMPRGFATSGAAAGAAATASPYPRGIIEMREYTLTPSGMAEWIRITEEYGALRKQLLPMMG